MNETLPIDRGQRELSLQSLKWTTPTTLWRILQRLRLGPASHDCNWPLPIASVIISMTAFTLQRDWTYVVFTLIVLAVLGYSLLVDAP